MSDTTVVGNTDESSSGNLGDSRQKMKTLRSSRKFNSLRPGGGLSLENSAFAIKRQSSDASVVSAIQNAQGTPGAEKGSHWQTSAMGMNGENRVNTSVSDTLPFTDDEREEEVKLRAQESRLSWEEKDAMNVQASKQRDEIINTEAAYLDNITTLVTYYHKRLQALDLSSFGLGTSQIKSLLSNIDVILTLHQNFGHDLRDVGPQRCEEAFIRCAHFFRTYTTYLVGYETAVHVLRNHTDKRFQTEVEKIKLDIASVRNLDLMSYLIMPVQRIPRYVMLLRTLRKYTLPSDPCFDRVNLALSLLSSIALDNNKYHKKADRIGDLFTAANTITGFPKDFALIEPHRAFYREIDVEEAKLSANSKTIRKNSPRIIFFCSDLLVLTSRDRVYKSHILLSSAVLELGINEDMVKDKLDADTLSRCCVLSNSNNATILIFPTVGLYQGFIDEVTPRIKACRDSREQLRNARYVTRSTGVHGKIMENCVTDEAGGNPAITPGDFSQDSEKKARMAVTRGGGSGSNPLLARLKARSQANRDAPPPQSLPKDGSEDPEHDAANVAPEEAPKEEE